MSKKQAKIYKLNTSKQNRASRGKKTTKNDDLDFFNMLDDVNKELDFLPPDSILLIPFMDPLLREAGLTKKKFENIIMKNSPTEEEIDILQWAAELGFLMMDLVDEEDEHAKELLREEAVDIAADYVPRIKSREIFPGIEVLFEELKNMDDADSNSDEFIN